MAIFLIKVFLHSCRFEHCYKSVHNIDNQHTYAILQAEPKFKIRYILLLAVYQNFRKKTLNNKAVIPKLMFFFLTFCWVTVYQDKLPYNFKKN